MKILILACFTLSIILFGVSEVEAAVVSIKNEVTPVAVGDTFILSVLIDTTKQNINVVEGTVKIVSGDENIKIIDLNVAGSDFTLWPNKPSIDSDQKTISFVAGTPGGINKSSALLFKVVVQAEQVGQIVVAPLKVKAFLNDGRATPVAIVQVNPLNFSIIEARPSGVNDSLSKINIGDNRKPYSFVANIGSDPSLYEGKTFVAFYALDGESGLDHYEVIEGNRPAVRTGSVYVFQNQEKLEPTTVIAYDKVGNSRKIFLREKTTWERISLIRIVVSLVLLVIILLLIWFGYKKLKVILKNKQNAKGD